MKAQVFSADPAVANGNSGVFVSNGRKALLVASGTFGGGTITVKVQQNATPTYLSTGQTLTASGILVIDLPRGAPYRFELSGSTTPSIEACVYVDEHN